MTGESSELYDSKDKPDASGEQAQNPALRERSMSSPEVSVGPAELTLLDAATEVQLTGESPPVLQQDPGLGDEPGPEPDDLMWLDEMDMKPEMNMNPHEDDDGLPLGATAESQAGGHEESDPGQAAQAGQPTTASSQIPDDPDEAIAWLERLAAKQGAPAEELPTVKSVRPDGADLVPDEAKDVPESATEAVPDTTPEAPIDAVAEPLPETDAATDAAAELVLELEVDDEVSAGMDAGEIPEDPDEAMAWLERLAAKEEAEAHEVVTDETALAGADIGDLFMADGPDTEQPLSEIDKLQETYLLDDLDEALGWLEELTAEPQLMGSAAETGEAVPPAEEPPTPAVAHDVDDALAGAELLFREPEAVQETTEFDETSQPEEALDFDDSDDAMAWLEQLAARQGAPIEELTTVDSVSGELAPDEAMPPDAEYDGPDAVEELREIVEEVDEQDAEPVYVAATDAPEEVVLASRDVDLEVTETEPGAVVVPEHAESGIDELQVVDQESVPAEDMAWLDTLGAVDAESWLEAEAAEDMAEGAPTMEGEPVTDGPGAAGDKEPRMPVAFLPDVPGSEGLAAARSAVAEAGIEAGLARYAELVDKGELLPFLINDLEAIYEERGPDPGLQRVLGDAYVRNGQLRKALESYREALDNI